MRMRKGIITRPRSAKEPMIRLTSRAAPTTEETATVEIPKVPKGWDEVLYNMFGMRTGARQAKHKRKSR